MKHGKVNGIEGLGFVMVYAYATPDMAVDEKGCGSIHSFLEVPREEARARHFQHHSRQGDCSGSFDIVGTFSKLTSRAQTPDASSSAFCFASSSAFRRDMASRQDALRVSGCKGHAKLAIALAQTERLGVFSTANSKGPEKIVAKIGSIPHAGGQTARHPAASCRSNCKASEAPPYPP